MALIPAARQRPRAARRCAALLLALGLIAGLGAAAPGAQARTPAWTHLASGTTDEITAVEYQADDRFWLTTATGKILRRAGGAFSQVASVSGVRFNDIEFLPAPSGIGIAGGTNGTVYRTADAGATWAPVAMPALCTGTPLGNVRKVAFAPSGAAYVFGNANQVARSAPGDLTTWSDANAGGAPCRTSLVGPITGAFFTPLPAASTVLTSFFGETAFSSGEWTGVPIGLNAGLIDSGSAPGRLAGDPAHPGRQWAIAADTGTGTRLTRTEDNWLGTAIPWTIIRGLGVTRTPGPVSDVAFNGGTVIAPGAAGQILGSATGKSFYFIDDPASRTVSWRAVGMASATQAAVGGTGGNLIVTSQANGTPDLIKPDGAIGRPATFVVGVPARFIANVTDDTFGSGLDPSGFRWTITRGIKPRTGSSTIITFPKSGQYKVQLDFQDLEHNASSIIARVEVLRDQSALPKAGIGTPRTQIATHTQPGHKATKHHKAVAAITTYKVRVSGKIKPADGVSKRMGCTSVLKVALTRSRRTFVSGKPKLSTRTCAYGQTLRFSTTTIGRTRKLGIIIRYAGNASMRTTSKTFTLRLPSR